MIRVCLNQFTGVMYTFDDSLISEQVGALREDVEAKLSVVFKLRGKIASVASLPQKNNTAGDVYIIADDDPEAAGAEYVWVEPKSGSPYWEVLGTYIQYYTKSQTYDREAIHALIKAVHDDLGNIRFKLTEDTTFQQGKEYYMYSSTLSTYLYTDTSDAVGEPVAAGTYYEVTNTNVHQELENIKETAAAKAEAAAQKVTETATALQTAGTAELNELNAGTELNEQGEPILNQGEELQPGCSLDEIILAINRLTRIVNVLARVYLPVAPAEEQGDSNGGES